MKIKLTLLAPFSHLSKAQELNILQELDKIHLMKHTLTCYNPDSGVAPVANAHHVLSESEHLKKLNYKI